MNFRPTSIAGAFVVEPERLEDERGFFARTWCRREFSEQGIDPMLVQANLSFNRHLHTLRGLHYQAAPFEEAKLVRCTMGRIFDVVVDLRPASGTFKEWHGEELSAENRTALFAPAGVAHGFLTLTPEAEVFYQMSQFFHPDSGRGVRWDDPAFSIEWPAEPAVISERDAGYPDFEG